MMLPILIALLFFVVCLTDPLVYTLVFVLALMVMVALYMGSQLITCFHFSDFNFNFIKKNLFYKIEIKMVLIIYKNKCCITTSKYHLFFFIILFIYNLVLQNVDIHKLWILFRK